MAGCNVPHLMDTTTKFIEVTEFDVFLNVNKDSLSPKRNEGYYCQDMDINRALVTTALSVFADSGDSVFSPVKCIDVMGSTGVAGLLWKKYLCEKVDVHINDVHETSHEIILQNSGKNNLDVNVHKKDPCVLLHEMPSSFVYLDCHTDAAFYLDSLMRNVAKQGLVAISTKDDGALYGRTPEIALRNYGGTITRTFYSKELAARLIIAGMVRSAAIHNKGLQVLCVLSVKSTITIILRILKGPAQANACLTKVKSLVHCSMCEDRAFYPCSIYPVKNPKNLLSCQCAVNTPGKVLVNLGPVWAGQLFNLNFICEMMHHLRKFPWMNKIKETMEAILTESRCPKLGGETTVDKPIPSIQETTPMIQDKEPPCKKKKKEDAGGNNSEEPCFYFNLHKHCPKGPKMVKASNVVLSLQKAGFRASRTHFDPLAVRTNASLAELINVIAHTPK